jgi:hypothetical protein
MRDWKKDDEARWGNAPLEQLVKDFFEILDTKEISNNFNEFHPVYISSCRVRTSCKLQVILERMRKLSDEAQPITEVEALQDVQRSKDIISVQ